MTLILSTQANPGQSQWTPVAGTLLAVGSLTISPPDISSTVVLAGEGSSTLYSVATPSAFPPGKNIPDFIVYVLGSPGDAFLTIELAAAAAGSIDFTYAVYKV